jgi:hypothetical protein
LKCLKTDSGREAHEPKKSVFWSTKLCAPKNGTNAPLGFDPVGHFFVSVRLETDRFHAPEAIFGGLVLGMRPPVYVGNFPLGDITNARSSRRGNRLA